MLGRNDFSMLFSIAPDMVVRGRKVGVDATLMPLMSRVSKVARCQCHTGLASGNQTVIDISNEISHDRCQRTRGNLS
jgi:hypothetical protein